jgi:hypothetical protein
MLKTQIKRLLSPSGMGWLLYTLVSLAILIGSTGTKLMEQLGLHAGLAQIFNLAGSYINSGLAYIDSNQAMGRLVLYIVWAGVGAIIYLLFWMCINVYIVLRNDLVIGTKFTSIQTHGHLKYWLETISRALVQLGAVLLVGLLTVIVAHVWYPVSVALFGAWIHDWSSASYWAALLTAVIGWMLVCHLYVVLARLALLRTRIIPDQIEEK